MNEETTKLVEKLASELGTTTEYLWSVLLKQAPIDATVTLIQCVLVLLFGWFLWTLHKRLIKPQTFRGYERSLYDEYEEGAIIPMFFGAIMFVILSVVSFASIGDVVNGYLNPEYWALNKILNSY